METERTSEAHSQGLRFRVERITMENWIVGIDGGGSKTKFVFQSLTNDRKIEYIGPGSNPTNCGLEGTMAVLSEGFQKVCVPSGTVRAVFAGIAGCLPIDRADRLEAFLLKIIPGARVAVRSDILNVILSDEKTDDCLAAIWGTGSVVFSYRFGRLRRFGGWGPEFDPGGNGYAMGRDAIRVALAVRDGLEKSSLLSEMVLQKMGTVHPASVAEIAAFAPLVPEAFRKGDPVAERLLDEHCSQLANLVNVAGREFDNPVRLILAGGLTGDPDLMNGLRKKLVRVSDIRICTDPSAGALRGARKLSRGETV